MENYKRILVNITEFFRINRRCGTTTLIHKIAKKNDCYILVPDLNSAKQSGLDIEKCITFDNMINAAGRENKPILVDNHTMIELCNKWYSELKNEEKETNDRQKLINTIEDMVKDFNRGKRFRYTMDLNDRLYQNDTFINIRRPLFV